jgi:hypothetical protein
MIGSILTINWVCQNLMMILEYCQSLISLINLGLNLLEVILKVSILSAGGCRIRIRQPWLGLISPRPAALSKNVWRMHTVSLTPSA